MNVICDKKKCTGCFACLNACTQDAIEIRRDELGKTIPYINQERCVNCGRCKKVCPSITNSIFNPVRKCFAIKSQNKEDIEKSASGGVASAFYRFFLSEMKGVIYGAVFDENMILRQKECVNIADIAKLRGSKYVQSYVGKTYRQVKQRLKEGKKVLYISTPCQIDGLKHYLGENHTNLLTVDIVCHGVPPMTYLKEYAEMVCKGRKIDGASFRGKNDYVLCFYENEDIKYSKKRDDDYYFSSFAEGYIFRDNCYQCKYAQNNRVSDITIGDFWGLNRESLKSKLEGRISLLLINTHKGFEFFELMKDEFIYEERSMQEALKENTQLNHPVKWNENMKKFQDNYVDKGFIKAVKATDFKAKKRNRKMEQSEIIKKMRTIKRRLMELRKEI